MKAALLKFGDFLYQKRIETGITLRRFAEAINVSAPYLSDIENGHRKPLYDYEKLKTAARLLNLCIDDQRLLYDLAGAGRDEIAPDIHAYIKSNTHVARAIRTALEMNAQENDWAAFEGALQRRRE